MSETLENLATLVENLQSENNLLRQKMDKMLQEEDDAKQRIVEATRQAEDIKKASTLEYSLTIKALTNFNEKFARVTSGGIDKTADIMATLSEFLREIGKLPPEQIVEKLDEKLFPADLQAEEPCEFEFDLEEAINPKKDLDLKTLCEELGVYRG